MKNKRWRTVAEGVAATGVIVSLVFVGFQIRQNTIASRAQAYQEIGLTVAEFWYDDALNPELLEIARRANAGDSLTEIELDQARARVMSILRLWETLFLHVEAGALPEVAMTQMGSWAAACDIPILRRQWGFFRALLGPDFALYVARTCGLGT